MTKVYAAKTKVTNNRQALEYARLARAANLQDKALQSALRNRIVTRCIRSLMLVYPDFVRFHLTPEYEVNSSIDPGEIALWQDTRQLEKMFTTGHQVYGVIREERLLCRSLSLGHLEWLKSNPDKIPAKCRGKLLYAWGSVVRTVGGSLSVPCLNCGDTQLTINWHSLDIGWDGDSHAGLREEV